MSQPLVSIIIPTYNGASRITKTLDSIINQNYENIEIIVVDDVSTDNTVEVCQNFLEKSGRKFTILKRTTNGRQSAARNTGIKAATGKYIMFFDHDDLAEKNFVSIMCEEAENKNADVVFCGIAHYVEKNNMLRLEPLKLTEKYSDAKDYIVKVWAAGKIPFHSMWNAIFRKSFLEEYNLHFTERCYFEEDTEFMLKALTVSSCTSFVKDCLYIHTYFDEQQTHAQNLVRNGQNHYRQSSLSRLRSGRYITRRIHDKRVRDYAISFQLPDALLKEFTMLAKFHDKEKYEQMLKFLRHKKLRELLLSSVKVLFRKPELFFKAILLLYFPKFYYRLRAK